MDQDSDKRRQTEQASVFIRDSISAMRDAYEKMFPGQGFLICTAAFPRDSDSIAFITNFSHTSIEEEEIGIALLKWAARLDAWGDESDGDEWKRINAS